MGWDGMFYAMIVIVMMSDWYGRLLDLIHRPDKRPTVQRTRQRGHAAASRTIAECGTI